MAWFRRSESAPGYRLGAIEISRPWARASTSEPDEAGGFLTIANRGTDPDRLIAAASPVAEKIEVHGIRVVGSGIAMRRLDNGLTLPAATTLTLQPRGYHLLLQGLKVPLAKGARFPVKLTFEKAGGIEIELTVEAEGLVGKDVLNEALQPR
jgi:copper(I)-binding protein